MKTIWIYLFWGGMDLFYIVRFSYINFSHGKVPIYSDAQSFFLMSAEHGLVSVALFLLSIVLNVSIIFSMFLFFLRARSASCLAYAQIPLRLLLVTPSLSFLQWGVKVSGATSVMLLFGLLLLSEVIKVCSMLYMGKHRTV